MPCKAWIIYVFIPKAGTVTRKDNSYLADEIAAGLNQTGEI